MVGTAATASGTSTDRHGWARNTARSAGKLTGMWLVGFGLVVESPGPLARLGRLHSRCGHGRLQSGQALGRRPAQRPRSDQRPAESDRFLESAALGQVGQADLSADRVAQRPVPTLPGPAEVQYSHVSAAPAGTATVHVDILHVELNVPSRIELDRRSYPGQGNVGRKLVPPGDIDALVVPAYGVRQAAKLGI